MDDGAASDSRQYSLKGLVHHIGTAMDQGHYIADAVRRGHDGAGSKWYRFNDETVTMMPLEDILADSVAQETVYMLLYTLGK
jgi:ubiquitin C-terminal hydrolase